MSKERVFHERKPSEAREKDLLLAISRIKLGRSKIKETKMTFAAVAREASVSTALIHNCYPKIAEAIREIQGHSSRVQRDAKRHELKIERDKSRELRGEIEAVRAKISVLISINEVLLTENKELKARLNDPKVVNFRR